MNPQKISQLPINSTPSLTDYLPELNTGQSLTQRITLTSLANLLASQFLPSGMITEYGGRAAPTGWLMCYGQAISRITYSTLFGQLAPSVGTFTITIASPGVITLNNHGFATGDQVYLTTTGALPTGLTANTLYYVVYVSSSTFSLATSLANAYAGTKINTTGSQSGTQTCYACPYGLGDGSSTFNVPDLRGRAPAGNDYMGGTAAGRLNGTSTGGQGTYGNLGANGGEQNHLLTYSEIPGLQYGVGAGGGSQYGNFLIGTSSQTNQVMNTNAGSLNHNIVQPTLVTNFIIKT